MDVAGSVGVAALYEETPSGYAKFTLGLIALSDHRPVKAIDLLDVSYFNENVNNWFCMDIGNCRATDVMNRDRFCA